jgi:hypothetical protein
MTRIMAAIVALAFAAPAAAQSFEAEIDCNGIFAPGDTVPFTVRLEEQAFDVHVIDFVVEIDMPGKTKTLIQKTKTLNPNQDAVMNRTLTLKAGAPAGSYDMRVIADDGALVVTDTCSFDVQ